MTNVTKTRFEFPVPPGVEPGWYGADNENSVHLAFGGGVHFCLGAHLARLESQVAIGSVVEAFEEITLLDSKTEGGRSLFRVPARIPVALG